MGAVPLLDVHTWYRYTVVVAQPPFPHCQPPWWQGWLLTSAPSHRFMTADGKNCKSAVKTIQCKLINCAYFSGNCNYYLQASYIIQQLGYPDNGLFYENNEHCEWILTSIYSNSQIRITFDSFDTEAGYDTLLVSMRFSWITLCYGGKLCTQDIIFRVIEKVKTLTITYTSSRTTTYTIKLL